MALSGEQRRVISEILRAGRASGANRTQLLAALNTAAVEANYKNPNYGDRDSVGWRQERASSYPGKDRMNVYESAMRFFQETRGKRDSLRPGALAQSAQRSAFPGRYAEHTKTSAELLRAFGAAGKGSPGGGGSKPSEAPVRTVERVVKQTTQGPDRKTLLGDYLSQRNDPNALLNLAAQMKAAEAQTTTTTQTTSQPAKQKPRVVPSTDSRGFTTGKGTWGGGAALATPAVKIAQSMGVPVTSRKRNRPDLGAGRASDHDVHNTNAYAVDLATSGSTGDRLARAIARRYGIPLSNIGTYNRHTITVNGKRYSLQLLWRVSGHYDHVHLGIRRV